MIYCIGLLLVIGICGHLLYPTVPKMYPASRNLPAKGLQVKHRRKLFRWQQLYAENGKPERYPVVVFALATGARKGEILGLPLVDLDLKRDVAILRNTKNKDTRAVPITANLKKVLEDHIKTVEKLYESFDEAPPKRWLFPRSDGLQPMDIRKAWENARKDAKLSDFRFHDLRHSTASYLAMNGANQVEIAEILGHRTLQMVRRYAHLSESHVKDLMENVNKGLF